MILDNYGYNIRHLRAVSMIHSIALAITGMHLLELPVPGQEERNDPGFGEAPSISQGATGTRSSLARQLR